MCDVGGCICNLLSRKLISLIAFCFKAACVPLNFSQLALSGDTMGNISMKDDNDNLRDQACEIVCVCGGGVSASEK